MSYRKVSERLGVCVAATLLVGCASAAETGGGGAAAAPAPNTPENVALVAQGMQLFQGGARCFVCHGVDASGGEFGPNLTDDNWVWVNPSDGSFVADLTELLLNGTPEPRMSTSGMPPNTNIRTEAQFEALAAYLRSF